MTLMVTMVKNMMKKIVTMSKIEKRQLDVKDHGDNSKDLVERVKCERDLVKIVMC